MADLANQNETTRASYVELLKCKVILTSRQKCPPMIMYPNQNMQATLECLEFNGRLLILTEYFAKYGYRRSNKHIGKIIGKVDTI